MPRLFVGLEIPEPFCTELMLPRSGVENARWQRDDQLHLTLAFIGDVSNRIAVDVEAELSRLSLPPLGLALSGVGFFGKPSQPKALWAGVSPPAPLTQLHEKISYAMGRIGAPVDPRRFLPHITLARFRRGVPARIGDWLSRNENLSSMPVPITHFSLFSSHLTEERAHYRVEARYGPSLITDLDQEELSHHTDGPEAWWDDNQIPERGDNQFAR